MKDGVLVTVAVTKQCIKEIRSAIKIAHPREAGGFLLGTAKQFRHALALPNISNTPEIEYRTFWREGLAFAEHYGKWLDAKERPRGRTEVRAFWHSHPGENKAIPSASVVPSQKKNSQPSLMLAGDVGFLQSMYQIFDSHQIGLSMIVSYENLRGGFDFTLMNSLQRSIPLKLPTPYGKR
jgi:proteasome lid subunit RPN8/RPN11